MENRVIVNETKKDKKKNQFTFKLPNIMDSLQSRSKYTKFFLI